MRSDKDEIARLKLEVRRLQEILTKTKETAQQIPEPVDAPKENTLLVRISLLEAENYALKERLTKLSSVEFYDNQ